MQQHEITESRPLLDEAGNLTEPGYAKTLLPVYDREAIRVKKSRIKEWDYYLIINPRCALALTIADNGYMGLDSISLMEFEKPNEVTTSAMVPFPMGERSLPASSVKGNVSVRGKGYELSFRHVDDTRRLHAKVKKFNLLGSLQAEIELTQTPEESMVICTPFHKPGHFYFNQKINCMRARGRVDFGMKQFVFNPEDSFAVLDWGRGVWTYKNTWYWGSGNGLDSNGDVFGFNIGYGFGDTSAATENMLFYKGKAHKISQVVFHIPQKNGRDDFMSPWRFTSDDGRFEMDFEPLLDRKSDTNVLLLRSNQHQVFGRYTGKAILDDGTVIEVKDYIGFAEKVFNKW